MPFNWVQPIGQPLKSVMYTFSTLQLYIILDFKFISAWSICTTKLLTLHVGNKLFCDLIDTNCDL